MTRIDHSPVLIEERLYVAARVNDVWSLIADPERMPEWSPELQSITWIGNSGPRVGGTFLGHNRLGPVQWQTRNVIELVDVARTFAWRTMSGPGYRFVCRWTYRLEPQIGGCDVTERFETAGWLAIGLTRGIMWGRGRMLRRSMGATLESVKAVAEGPGLP